MRFVMESSIPEICAATGMTPKAIEMRTIRACRKLEPILRHLDFEPNEALRLLALLAPPAAWSKIKSVTSISAMSEARQLENSCYHWASESVYVYMGGGSQPKLDCPPICAAENCDHREGLYSLTSQVHRYRIRFSVTAAVVLLSEFRLMEQASPVSEPRLTRSAVDGHRSWNQRESVAYICCFLAALVFAGLTAHDMYRQRRFEREQETKQFLSRLIPVRSTEIMAGRSQFRGDSNAPFTLIEFGDYECPPCRATQKILAGELAKYKRAVRLDFRQFPALDSLHRHARHTAATRRRVGVHAAGKFWRVHDRLFCSGSEFRQGQFRDV